MQTLKHEIRSSIAPTDARANEPDRCEMKKIFRSMPFWTTRFDQCHAKHTIVLERVLEHVPVARFENIKRQQRVRKKHRPRQWHHRYFIGQSYRLIVHFPVNILGEVQLREGFSLINKCT